MKVDREQLMQDGYLILREVVPPDALEKLRANYETLIERQGGRTWLSEGKQPRLNIVPHLDEATADAAEIWLHDNTLGVARQLITVGDAVTPTSMWCMCSPLEDKGPAAWHRDIHPFDMAPMRLLQLDMLENGPRYVQWNIPLYDDDVLWVVPGSHRRVNTAQENEELLKDRLAPLTGGIPVELKAGDGVIYINFLLHWGSNYSSKLRRTLHGGHAIFTDNEGSGCARHLSPSAREQFAGWDSQVARTQDTTEAALRAVLDGDGTAFDSALDTLQPGMGVSGKLVLTIYLCKAVQLMRIATCPDLGEVPEALQRSATGSHSISLNWGPGFAHRFTAAELEKLWQRFEFVDTRLLHTEEYFVPGYQSGPMQYFFEDVAEPFTASDFVASWS
jgi:hypothetical protein